MSKRLLWTLLMLCLSVAGLSSAWSWANASGKAPEEPLPGNGQMREHAAEKLKNLLADEKESRALDEEFDRVKRTDHIAILMLQDEKTLKLVDQHLKAYWEKKKKEKVLAYDASLKKDEEAVQDPQMMRSIAARLLQIRATMQLLGDPPADADERKK